MLDWKDILGRFRRKRARQARVRALEADGSFLSASAQVLGWDQVRIGRHCVIGDDAWLNVNHRDAGKTAIVIGDHSFLGRRNFLNAGSLIELGPFCLTGPDCHLVGADHIYSDPWIPYVASGTTAEGVIRLGTNCWLGTRVTVLKDVAIGYGSVIGAGSIVTRDLPPLSLAVGSPARVVKRFDLVRREWVAPDDATPPPPEDEYRAQLLENFSALRLPAIAASAGLGDL